MTREETWIENEIRNEIGIVDRAADRRVAGPDFDCGWGYRSNSDFGYDDDFDYDFDLGSGFDSGCDFDYGSLRRSLHPHPGGSTSRRATAGASFQSDLRPRRRLPATSS